MEKQESQPLQISNFCQNFYQNLMQELQHKIELNTEEPQKMCELINKKFNTILKILEQQSLKTITSQKQLYQVLEIDTNNQNNEKLLNYTYIKHLSHQKIAKIIFLNSIDEYKQKFQQIQIQINTQPYSAHILEIYQYKDEQDHYYFILIMKKGIVLSDMESITKEQAIQIFQYLEELHKLQIYHLDIRPETIILEDDKLKFIDFSNSIIIDQEDIVTVKNPPLPTTQRQFQVQRCNSKYTHADYQMKFVGLKDFSLEELIKWDAYSLGLALNQKLKIHNVNFQSMKSSAIPTVQNLIKLIQQQIQ